MRVIVKPMGYLKKYLKDYMKEGETQAELFVQQDSMSIREFLEQYNFEINKVGFVLCNGNIVTFEHMLKDGDRLSLMTMLAGG